MVEQNSYGDRPALDRPIKEAAIRLARFNRFLSRVFARGEDSEWLLKDEVSILTRVPKSLATKDINPIPKDWARAYPNLAAGVLSAGVIDDAHEAEEFVRRMVDPALAPDGAPAAARVPGAGWTDADRLVATAAAVEQGDDGSVHERHHTRSGWPVRREHWRAPRGTAGGTTAGHDEEPN
jgi:hypothetical protein